MRKIYKKRATLDKNKTNFSFHSEIQIFANFKHLPMISFSLVFLNSENIKFVDILSKIIFHENCFNFSLRFFLLCFLLSDTTDRNKQAGKGIICVMLECFY